MEPLFLATFGPLEIILVLSGIVLIYSFAKALMRYIDARRKKKEE